MEHFEFAARAIQNNLGLVALKQGELDTAEAYCMAALEAAEAANDKAVAGYAYLELGQIALAREDFDQARIRLQHSLRLLHQLVERRKLAVCLEIYAHLAVSQGQAERAARLAGASEALRASIGVPVTPADLPDHERLLETLRVRVGTRRFDSAWAAGQALSLDQAVREAMQV